MVSRRHVLLGAAATGGTILAGCVVTACQAASQPRTDVAFTVPSGACDCHTHVFGDPARYPYASTRRYTPEPASVSELRALHQRLRIGRVVIVQPSVHGSDNACTLDAIQQLGRHARGVAVIDDTTSPSAMADMHRIGVRGIRLNLETGGVTDPVLARRRFQRAVEQTRGLGWHIQLYTRPPMIDHLKDLVMDSPMPVVFDHFGGAQASLGTGQPGFDALLDVVRAGRAYVKLSAPYLASNRPPDLADVTSLAKALVATNAGRMLWATNWPHPDSTPSAGRSATDVTPLYQIDDGRVFNQFAAWIPDAAVRQAVLVENPTALYGF